MGARCLMTRFPFPHFALPAAVLWTACLCVNAYGQGSCGWESQFGPVSSTANAYAQGGVSTTAEGVYVAGFTAGPLPGQTYVGPIDGFLRKYDFSGNELWTHEFSWPPEAWGAGVSATAEGIYLLEGIVNGFFLCKYDLNGNELWTRPISGA